MHLNSAPALHQAKIEDQGKTIYIPNEAKPYKTISELVPENSDQELAYKIVDANYSGAKKLADISENLYVAIDYDLSIENNKDAIERNKKAANKNPVKQLGDNFDIFKLNLSKFWNS